MTGTGDEAVGAALWRRWRLDRHLTPPPEAGTPDPVLLAAYAEGRLGETEAEPIEDWLAEHPAALDDILAAAAATVAAADEAVPETIIQRATALVSEDEADAALWQLWRRDADPAASDEAEPDFLQLAAYAEGRIGETEAEALEDWLVEHPEALEDVLAAGADPAANDAALPERIIFRAAALVPAAASGARGAVVPFPLAAAQRRRLTLRTAVAWGGLAASLLLTSLIGFGIGNNAYDTFAGHSAAVDSVANDLMDPPSSLFDEDEEPDT